MKKLLLLIALYIVGNNASFGQTVAELHSIGYTLEVEPGITTDRVLMPATLDTIPESMHVATRKKGFVFAQVALSVRRNGYCIGHLDCNRKPFPVHYTVGWCEGKEEVYRAIVELLNNKR
jgi:hypothetical protein